jgi:hypothetical protein
MVRLQSFDIALFWLVRVGASLGMGAMSSVFVGIGLGVVVFMNCEWESIFVGVAGDFHWQLLICYDGTLYWFTIYRWGLLKTA